MKTSVIPLLALLTAAIAVAQQPDPRETENRVAGEIREARENVERIGRMLADRNREVERTRAPYEAARAAFDRSRGARETAERNIAAFRGNLDAATAAIDAKIATAKAEADAAQEALRTDPNDSSKRNEFIANAYALESLYRRRDRILERLRADARMNALKEACRATDDPYWRDYREYVHAASDYGMHVRLLEDLQKELTAAEERLQIVRLEAVKKLEGVTPPYLEKVVMTSDGRVVYSATWVPAADVIDERIAFMRRAIEFQRNEIISQTRRRDEWLERYVEASDEVQAKIRAYESAIWSQCYKSIAIELGDAAISVALDWKQMGPFAVVWQAVEKTADAVTGTMGGDYNERYALPASSGSPPPPFSGGSVLDWCTDAGVDRYKNIVKLVLEGAAGGEFQALDHYGSASIRGRRFDVPKLDQADLWVIVKREAMEGGGEALIVRRVFNPESLPAAWRSLRGAFRDTSVRELAGNFKQRLMTRDFWKEFGKGMAIDFAKDIAKSAAHDAARDERFAVWEEFLSADAYAIAVLRQLQMESNMLRSEHVQLKGYLKYLKELVDEKERVLDERRLRVETDEVAGRRTVEVELTFSRDVIEVNATLAGVALNATGSGTRWSGKAEVGGTEKTAVLSVDAKDALSQRPVDSDPMSIPKWKTDKNRWEMLEAGPDKNHRVKLTEMAPGVSIVLLVDCSGSMKEGGRMENAKSAAKRALESGTLGPDDEVALWALFEAGDIRLLCEFTKETGRVISAIDGLSPKGATPLADGILAAGSYAVTHARNERKLLLVFSDGEETCGGNPARAMRRVQDMGVEAR
jgi:hypothetical protein